MKVEEIKNLKVVTDKIIQVTKESLKKYNFNDEHNPLESDFEFCLDGVVYTVISLGDDGWSDEGKYQFCNEEYQLVSFDKTKINYPCSDNIIDEFNLLFDVSVSRSGSYYSDYYYNYEIPTLKLITTKLVPEQIIPAHEVIDYIKIK